MIPAPTSASNSSISELHGDSRAPGKRQGVIALVLSLAAIGCVWCVVLPWYAERPVMKQHLEFLDDRGIDPSAMFYTELDAMDAILEKLEGEH